MTGPLHILKVEDGLATYYIAGATELAVWVDIAGRTQGAHRLERSSPDAETFIAAVKAYCANRSKITRGHYRVAYYRADAPEHVIAWVDPDFVDD